MARTWHGAQVREALRVLGDGRPACKPNGGFERCLARLEMRLHAAAPPRAPSSPLTASPAMPPLTGISPTESLPSSRALQGTKRPREEERAAADGNAAAAAASATSGVGGRSVAEEDLHAALARLSDGSVAALEGVRGLAALFGAASTFVRVAEALSGLLRATSPLAASDDATPSDLAVSIHEALRRAIGNGRGLRLPKLRAAYEELFESAAPHAAHMPPALADDVALWALAAATHTRLIGGGAGPPSKDHGGRGAALQQLAHALRRLADESRGGSGGSGGGSGSGSGSGSGGGSGAHVGGCGASGGSAAPIGGMLARDACVQRAFEALEAANGLIKEEWARGHVLEALGLAQALGAALWKPSERAAIQKWLSTARARGYRL